MTSNLIALPLKLTQPVESLADSLVQFIDNTSDDTHPDQIREDAIQLQELREQATAGDSLNSLTAYYAQLTYLITKLPLDVGIPFPWYPIYATPSATPLSLGAFQPSSSSLLVTLPNWQFERLSILFNLASMYCALGVGQRRSEGEGMKASIAAFQNAAGLFAHLVTLLPSSETNSDEPLSPDLTKETLEACRDLCLAQAQEVFWQKGVMDRLKNGTVSKLAARVAELYGQARTSALEVKARGASGQWVGFGFPEAVINHLEIKQLHFAAVAQYRKSVDDLGANRYGDELGRLEVAEGYVKKALGVSKRGVAEVVLKDLKSLQTILVDNRTRAQKDNSLIYLEPPTSLSSLPPIIPASMARSTLPSLALAPGKPFLFTRLQAREVNLLLALYLDRRTEFLRSSVQHPLQGLDAKEARVLHSLGLPASLEAVSRVVGFPHGVRERMGEVRRDGGAGRCRGMLGDVRRVARGARGGLEEAMTFLHREKEEDDALRAQYGTERWTRESSEVAGAEWRAKVEGLKGVLEQAGESDLLVRRKFGEWEARLELLGGEESALEASIPRLEDPSHSSPTSTQSTALRTLRHLLDDLTDLRSQRHRTLEEVKYVVTQEDVRAAVVEVVRDLQSQGEGRGREMSEYEGWVESELAKFARFERGVKEGEGRWEDLVQEIKTANDAFLHSRRTDPALAAREKALQDLDATYHMHREILTNLQEGLQFYADLTKMVGEVREQSRVWMTERSAQAKEMVQGLQLVRGVEGVRLDNVAGGEPARAWRPEDGIRFG